MSNWYSIDLVILMYNISPHSCEYLYYPICIPMNVLHISMHAECDKTNKIMSYWKIKLLLIFFFKLDKFSTINNNRIGIICNRHNSIDFVLFLYRFTGFDIVEKLLTERNASKLISSNKSVPRNRSDHDAVHTETNEVTIKIAQSSNHSNSKTLFKIYLKSH